ncbi:MAG TPA: glycosyltransferase family A protein [Thermoanaerobaculia bacterium]|nr:glycosyltransferase family A protein [Thermoanaerobaculia bacterium]
MTREDGEGSKWDSARELYFRLAASGLVSPRHYLPSMPDAGSLAARSGHLDIEIVSHCWKYHGLLAYQLSSLVNHPPKSVSVRMTVFHSREDAPTVELLDFFSAIQLDGVTWNFQPLETPYLLRRAIGRNLAARATTADWIWFTDCDVIFHEDCLDTLAERLQGRRDPLVFPQKEHCTALLTGDDPMLTAAADAPRVVDIDVSRFTPRVCSEAKGPLQITHGDVARACGYCECLDIYQKPARHWRKAYEDRAFRWLLRTEGVGLDIGGVYRIRHAAKGRYADSREALVRGSIRRVRSWMQERWLGR